MYEKAIHQSVIAYETLVDAGIAPESARFVLPLATRTRMYMKASARTWIHYFDQRISPHAQKEHREVATAIREEFKMHFPTVHEAMSLRTSEVDALKQEVERLKTEIEELKKGNSLSARVCGSQSL